MNSKKVKTEKVGFSTAILNIKRTKGAKELGEDLN
jgi:hypothetical protein